MTEITLSTPLSRIVMPDKLRSRLNILKCRTFRDAMEADPDKWENVSAKVVNAMKRFKKDYNDIYVSLFDADGSPLPASTGTNNPNTENRLSSQKLSHNMNNDRRFFVANNLLSAYAAAGLMPADKESLDIMMAKIMRQADAFIKAYDLPVEDSTAAQASATPIDDEEAVPAKPRRGRKPKAEAEMGSGAKKSRKSAKVRISPRTGKPMRKYKRRSSDAKAEKKPAPTMAESIKPGDVIRITEYIGAKVPIYKKFRPGDKVTVTKVSVKRTGRIEAEGKMGEKVATFASDRYGWVVEHDDSTTIGDSITTNEPQSEFV